MTSDFATLQPIIQAARKRLDQGTWDYLAGGSESETTLRRNRGAFDRIAFRPRVLRDVSKIDPSTTFLGQHLRIPVLTAPIGSLQLITPEGGAATAQATSEFGIVPVFSSVTEPALEVTAATGDGPKMFQLYVRGDMAWVRDILGRVKAAGYKALALTVDTAVGSRRERPLLSIGYTTPTARGRTAASINYQAQVTWETMDMIKEIGGLPFMLKGIQTAEDAALAVEHGVDVIWVSNHGGRQIDHGLASMTTLPQIAAAVNGRARIIVDGGVQRGSDVLKAVAMGADAVAIGRLQGYGLAAAGAAGLVRVLEILESEIVSAMGLLGVSSIGQLGPEYLCEADPVTPPHEMSSWVNLPGGRVL
jgi:glycolate oxidase